MSLSRNTVGEFHRTTVGEPSRTTVGLFRQTIRSARAKNQPSVHKKNCHSELVSGSVNKKVLPRAKRKKFVSKT